MKNWIRKPLLGIGISQFPVFIFTGMGGGFVGLVSVDVQAYLLFPSSIAPVLVVLWQWEKHYPVESYVLSAGDIKQHSNSKMDLIGCPTMISTIPRPVSGIASNTIVMEPCF